MCATLEESFGEVAAEFHRMGKKKGVVKGFRQAARWSRPGDTLHSYAHQSRAHSSSEGHPERAEVPGQTFVQA